MPSPQALVIAWLFVAIVGGVIRALVVPRKMMVLTRGQQRVASLGFAVLAAAEGLLLWQGGFWK